MRIGFVGLGEQGGAIAMRMLATGHDMLVWDKRPEVLAKFSQLGASTASAVTELGGCELVQICVVDDQQVEDVLVTDGLLAALSPGAVVAVHSTIHPDTCVRLAQVAEGYGVGFVDAPVSGGAKGAREGRLVVMVGGDRAIFERYSSVFEAPGSAVYMGSVGSGQLAKLLNNTFFAVQLAVSYELARLAREMDIDLAGLSRVLPKATAASWVLSRYAASGFTHLGPFIAAGREHVIRLTEKDVALFDDVVDQRRLEARDVNRLAAFGLELLRQGGPLIFDSSVDFPEYQRRIAVLDAPTAK
jgi:3-hydroxyisobutyrate dehydrogenase-like beta-hydroxyacid dehydrogenase